jgi:hypothetical protein
LRHQQQGIGTGYDSDSRKVAVSAAYSFVTTLNYYH